MYRPSLEMILRVYLVVAIIVIYFSSCIIRTSKYIGRSEGARAVHHDSDLYVCSFMIVTVADDKDSEC